MFHAALENYLCIVAEHVRKEKRDINSRYDVYPDRPCSSQSGIRPVLCFLSGTLQLLVKNTKILVLILIIGAAIYFFSRNFCTSDVADREVYTYSMGCSFDTRRYDATETFEALSNNSSNSLPKSISLEKYAPRRQNQGMQGSCVAWASSYAALSILYSRETGLDPNETAFSPSYLHTRIAFDNCERAYLVDAMWEMKIGGVLPLSKFAYDEFSCSHKPEPFEESEARRFSIKGFNRLTESVNDYRVNLSAIKQNLAQGSPVVIGMMAGGSFTKAMQGQTTWFPKEADYNMRNFGGHAMCVIGYDDYHEGGAFQLMNSWGEDWGQGGLAWVRYKDFSYFVKEAYGLYPLEIAVATNKTANEISFNIRIHNDEYAEGRSIPFRIRGKGLANSETVVSAKEKFNIEVINSLPCYIYLFGEESDGGNYILFPYSPKHSPYCGITGARQFPKDSSLYIEKEGEKHRFALVVSHRPLDYLDLAKKLDASGVSELAEKLEMVLGPNIWLPVTPSKKGLTFSYPVDETAVRAVVVELNN
jgi:hypothetical protein